MQEEKSMNEPSMIARLGDALGGPQVALPVLALTFVVLIVWARRRMRESGDAE